MLSCCEMLLLFGQIQGRVTLKGLFVKEKRNEERKNSFCRLGQNLFLDLGKICPKRPLENDMKINYKFWYSGQRNIISARIKFLKFDMAAANQLMLRIK